MRISRNATLPGVPSKSVKKRGIWIGVITLIAIGLVAGTKIVPHDDPSLESEAPFSAEQFGKENFPEVRDLVLERAVNADELAGAIASDPDAAAEKYGQEASGGVIYSVNLTGTAGEGASGIYEVDVDGVPDDLLIRIQTGPAINGTELRDVSGEMTFGDFANQIQFQDAASALNNEMKDAVLAEVDTANLEGKALSVTGVFTFINPDAWLLTPVQLELQ